MTSISSKAIQLSTQLLKVGETNDSSVLDITTTAKVIRDSRAHLDIALVAALLSKCEGNMRSIVSAHMELTSQQDSLSSVPATVGDQARVPSAASSCALPDKA